MSFICSIFWTTTLTNPNKRRNFNLKQDNIYVCVRYCTLPDFKMIGNTTDSDVADRLDDLPIFQIWESRLGLSLVKYVQLILVIVGTIGNGLSVAVLLRRRMRNTSVNVYLACLAFADTAVLYLSGFKTWLRVVTDIELLHLSGFSCKLLTFLFMTALHASAWFVVLVTADRFVVVWIPFKATTICTRRRGCIASCVMMTAVVIYNLHLLWNVDLFIVPPANKVRQCVGANGNSFMNGPYEVMKLVSYAFVPFVLVLLMNIGIIVKICKHSKQQPKFVLRYDLVTDKRVVRSRQQLTVMLLVVSFTWLILPTPFTLISIFPVSTPDDQARAKQLLAKVICFLLLYLNHSINFFLYCIAGRKFRVELVCMFRDLCARCRRLDRSGSLSSGSSRIKSRSRTKSKKTKMTPATPDVVDGNL